MPKSNQQILKEFNANSSMPLDLRASIENNNKSLNNNDEYKNGLYEIIYGQKKAPVEKEKELIFNEFFADLFDVSNIEWKIKNTNNQSNKVVAGLLKTYLTKTNFNLKLWTTKLRSGLQGKYAIIISKEATGEFGIDKMEYTNPVLTPARINYKNSLNDKVYEISVVYDDFPISGNSIYLLKKIFSLIDNKIQVDTSFVDLQNGKDIDLNNIPNELKSHVTESIKEYDWNFIPVSVLQNDSSERPRIEKIKSRLQMLNNYDEILAILPHWEKGSIIFNGSPVLPQNQAEQSYHLIRSMLLNGFVQMKPIDNDGVPGNLSENIVNYSPPSIMQTLRNTRNDLYNELKTDIGIPNMDEVKSAQQSTAEIMVKNFLTSPIIERETMLLKVFLIDLAKKFLYVLKECNIPEKFPDIDLKEWTIDVDLKINSDKNVTQILSNANNQTKVKQEGEKTDEK